MKRVLGGIAILGSLVGHCSGAAGQQAEALLQVDQRTPTAPCPDAAFLILEQGKLAGVDWVEHSTTQVHTRSILTQSRVIDATIDVRPDQTAARSSVILSVAGGTPEPVKTRDLGTGAVYLSDFIFSSVEQAVARARVLDQPVAHIPGASLYRDSSTDMEVDKVDSTDWTVSFHDKRYQVLTDKAGCVLSATLPEYGVVVERRTDFRPEQYPLWAPYSAPPDKAYKAEEVNIRAPQGHLLAGTISIPNRSKPVPAVILITGLGPAERNGGLPPWMPLRDLADALTRAGVAVLRVDDRGVGKSTGDHAPSTTFDEESDVETELAWLRSRPAIDPKRIGLVGYSEGALIAAMIASKDPAIAGVISIAGTGVTGSQLAREQTTQSVLHDPSVPPEKREQEIEKELEDPLTPRERVFLTIDPLQFARGVRCPTLVLQGGSDITVPVRSAERLANAMRENGNRDVTVRIIPGVSHSLLPDPNGPASGWPYLPAFLTSPELLDTMTQWVSKHLVQTKLDRLS